MGARGILYSKTVSITDNISIVIPTVGDIYNNESEYYGLLTSLTAMPIDLMVELDDMGIDFAEISEYDLFVLLFNGLKEQDTSLIFGDLDLSKFEPAINNETEEVVFLDQENDIVIDRGIADLIATTLRKIHHLEKNIKKPGNKEARDFLIERARKKQRREKNKPKRSQLEQMIVAMVNTEQFKYDYRSVLDLSIYQFNESVMQIINKVDYEHTMHGVYAGTIDAKHLSQDDLNWLTHK